MSDFAAIAAALAGRYAPAQVTPPTGMRNIRVSTYQPAEDVPPLPCVMVFPPESGAFDTGNGTRKGAHDWVIRFLYDQAGDMARQAAALLAWLTVLADQLKISAQLGGIVVSARLDGYKVGYFSYANKDYAGIELRVTVITSEAWVAVS